MLVHLAGHGSRERCAGEPPSAGQSSTGRSTLVARGPLPRYNLRMPKRLAIAIPLLLALVFSGACTIAKERPPRTIDEATGGEGMERMFWKEVQASNQTELGRALATNYVGVTPSGTLDRTATLQLYQQFKLTDFSIGDLRTELNGVTFVVTYSIMLNGTFNGQPLPSSPQHLMSVWQQQKKGWIMIAHSVSP